MENKLTASQSKLLLVWIERHHVYVTFDERGPRIIMLTYYLLEDKIKEILDDFTLDALENAGANGLLKLFLRFK